MPPRLSVRRPWCWLETVMQDARFAGRLAGRAPWLSLTVLATLTVGIGLNVSVFTLLNALLLRPWVTADPATFVSVIPRFTGDYPRRFSDYASLSQPDYTFFRDSARSLESLAAYRFLNMTLAGSESGSIRGALISCNLFDVIKPGPPLAGRYLTSDECAAPASPAAVAVLGETAWRNRFASDPGIVGRTIHLNRLPVVVGGVVPSFGLSASAPTDQGDVFLPYTLLHLLRHADEYFSDPRAQWLTVVGRRHPAYSPAQVEQELRLLAREADERVPGRAMSVTVTNGSLVQDPEIRERAPLIFSISLGTTMLLLLLACVNVTTLLLSRSAARQREIAVRMSLGAGRARLLRQFLTEGLLLGAVAGAASLPIARRAPAAIWYSIVGRPAPFGHAPDSRVLLYAVTIALAAGVITGLSPAFDSLRAGVVERLKKGSAALTVGRPRTRFRAVLVALQVALSLLLAVQVALFGRVYHRFFAYDPGFETRHVVTLTLASVGQGFDPSPAFYDGLEARVRALPGVAGTSYASLAPWSGVNPAAVDEIDGTPIPRTRDYRHDPARRMVSPEYFAVLDIPMRRGRSFTREEQASAGAVVPAVISEAMARRYWPGRDPVGRRFRVARIHEVVGVCADVQSLDFMREDGPFYYVPADVTRVNPPYMLIRTHGETGPIEAAVREVVGQADPQMAIGVTSLKAVVERHGGRLKPFMLYGSAAAAAALLLALSGVYAVVSCSVGQRIREIGIRLALGAQRRDILRLVLRSALLPLSAGLAAGVGLALLAGAGTRVVLPGVNPWDPWTLTWVALSLSAAALGAVWLPASRAARVDPMTSLRQD